MKQKTKKQKIAAPLKGNFAIFTKGNLKVSNGYEQIIFERIPFLEILPKNIVFENLQIPFHQRWRENDHKSKHIEYRTKDYCRVKILFIKNKNRFYVSAFDVTSIQYPTIIEKRSKK